MVTEEEKKIFSEDEPEWPSDESNILGLVAGDSVQLSQSRPWGYFIAGMGLTLLAVALGAVLGYLVRPTLDPATAAANVTTLIQAPVAIQAPSAQADPATEPITQTKTQAGSAAAENNSNPSRPSIMDYVLSDARHFQGSGNAPVTIVEFSDFKCPFCGRFSTETLPQIQKDYVDTGKVRFVYKHFAILGQESNRAAEATECAAEQDKFWEYHDQVFVDQATNRSTLSDEKLATLADEIGLEIAAFKDCLTSGRYTGQIQRESQAVGAMGVRGTPGFLINGVFISGAQPYEVFQQVIEEQLKNMSQ